MPKTEPLARWVDDVHARINRTRVARCMKPQSPEEVAAIVRASARRGMQVCVAGARHSMADNSSRAACSWSTRRGWSASESSIERKGASTSRQVCAGRI
jgi:FAD/FMN-containing dehydrogenase